jgi:hypothetical protein
MGIVLTYVVANGEDIPGREIVFRDGKWYDECHEQLGKKNIRISRTEAMRLIGDEISFLSDEEKRDILISDTLSCVKEKFELLGFTWEEMEDWCEKCYRLGLNPLPALRDNLKGICNVAFAYSMSGAVFSPEKDGICCWLDNSDGYSVSLQFCRGTE